MHKRGSKRKAKKNRQIEDWKLRPEVEGVTIDSAHSMDLDDAINLVKQDNGWLVQVSIADVSFGVPMDSDFDKRAKKIAFTRYFADNRNYPMLPREISEDQYSLLEGQNRPVLTVSIPLSRKLEVGELDIHFMKLKSKHKLSYSGVDKILENKSSELYPFLSECKEIAVVLLEGRRQRGALAIYDLYRGWMTTEEGKLVKIDPELRHIANIIVQEFMILANQGVAEFAAKNEIPILFRNHVAKTIAPQHHELMSDIYSAIQDPIHFSVLNIQKRMNLVLSRAIYSPLLLGHFGLNLPAYTHFTSPIRRYSDLVTHRMISAFLRGEEFPYTKDELFEISRYVTKIDQEIRDERIEGFKTRALEKSKKELLKGGLKLLQEDDFHRILSYACKNGALPDELESELIKRINENYLPIQDLFYVLFKVKEDCGDQWQNVRKEALLEAANSPAKAVSILDMVKQNFSCSEDKTETKGDGPSHQQKFTSIMEMSIGDKHYVSQPCISISKKSAEQLASLDLIAKIAGIPLDSIGFKLPELGETLVLVVREDEEITENYKGMLVEICQKNKFTLPKFQITKSGPPHSPEFKGTASIRKDGHIYESNEVMAHNKKNAEQLACKDLLTKIPESIPEDKEPQKPENVKSGNFIILLQEYCQKNGLDLPIYIDSGVEGPVHSLTLTVVCKLVLKDKTIECASRAPNKKAAKQGAAEQAYRQLVEYFE